MQFKTSQGSLYKFYNGKTKRFKSLHQFHLPSDQGWKEESDLTVFVDPQFSREVGMWGSSSANKKRLILFDNHVFLVSIAPNRNEHGLDKIIHDNSFVNTPKIGLSPLELFKQDLTHWTWLKPGMIVFSGSHPGNPVTEIINN